LQYKKGVEMKIDKIIVACSKRDFYFAKICIASIRYWYATIPISLIVDEAWGKVDTGFLEKNWEVTIYPSHIKEFEESFIKLVPIVSETNSRILLLDCDLVFLGKIVDEMEKFNEDFIADVLMADSDNSDVNKWWFNTAALKQWDTQYIYPGFVFYGGQLVLNTNKINKDDLDKLLIFSSPPKLKQPEIFSQGFDQGILNYIVAKKVSEGEMTFRAYPFMITQFEIKKLELINIDNIHNRTGYPQLIHWNGAKKGITSFIPASAILHFYEKYYYSKTTFPVLRLYLAKLLRTLQHPANYTYSQLKFIYKLFTRKKTEQG
jgi:lipopolysaccharide biosynthesis glycosyltransferase